MDSNIDVKIFSPNQPIGIFIILIGLIFIGIIIYIIYSVSNNKESINDKKIRKKKEFLQKEKIEKLLPKRRSTLIKYIIIN